MNLDELTLIEADGTFEVTFVDDGVPGVFLPITTVAHGQMSAAAFRRYLFAKRRMTDAELENFVRSADRRRLERPGSGKGPITVTTTDFK